MEIYLKLYKSGARFFLEVKGRKVSVNSNKLNLTVTYDGFPSWADGFKIGIKRNSSSPVEILPNGENFEDEDKKLEKHMMNDAYTYNIRGFFGFLSQSQR
jgi:hypothetical protein